MDIMSSPSYLPSPWYSVKDDITAITDQQLQSAKDRAASVDRLIKLYGEPKSTRYTSDLLPATRFEPTNHINHHHHVRIDTSPSSSPIVSKYLVELAPRSLASSSTSATPASVSFSSSSSDIRDRMTFSSTAPASSSLVIGSNAATGSLPHQHVTMTTRPGSSLAFAYSSSSTRDKYTTFLPTPPSSHSHHVPASAAASSAAFLDVDNIKQDSISQESSPLSDLDLDYMHDQGVYTNGLSTRAALSSTLTGTSAAQSERFVLSRDQDTHKTEPLHSEYSKLDPAPTTNHSVSSDRDLLPARSSLSSSSSSTTSRPYSNYLTTAHPLPPNHHRYHVDVVQGGRDVNTPYMPVAESFTKRRTSASGAGLRVTFADTERVSYKQMLNGDSPLREQHQMTSSSLSSSVPLNVESMTSLEMRQKTTTPLELPPSDGSRLNSTQPASSSSYRTAYQLAFSTTLPTPSAGRNKSDAAVLRSASFRQTPTDYRQQELPSFRFNVSNQSPDQASWRSFIQEKSPAINSTPLSSAKQAFLPDSKSNDLTVATRSLSRLGSDPLMSTLAAKSEATSFSNDLFVRRSLSKPIGGQGQGQGQGVTGGLLELEQQRSIGRLDGAAERMANIYNSSSYPFKKDNSASDTLHKPAYILSSSPSRASELQHWSRQPDVLAPVVPSLLDTVAGRNPTESSLLTGGQQQQHWSRTSSNNASLIQSSAAAGRSHSLGRGITSTNSNGWLTDEAEPFEPVTPYNDSTLRASPKVAINNITLNVSDDYYVKQIQAIVGRTGFVDNPSNYLCSSGPARLLPYLYIGGYREADDLACLRRLGITHVLNCAASDDTSRLQHTHNGKASPYPAGCSVIAYEQFDADDDEDYDILQHFDQARQFIDRAKYTRGRCLVHCAMGINRSGAICAAYILLDQQLKLLDVVRLMKQRRGTVLWNRGFQRMLVRFARQRGLL